MAGHLLVHIDADSLILSPKWNHDFLTSRPSYLCNLPLGRLCLRNGFFGSRDVFDIALGTLLALLNLSDLSTYSSSTLNYGPINSPVDSRA